MTHSRFALTAVFVALAGPSVARPNELPEQFHSAACHMVPMIDGVIGDEEWRDAVPLEFAMKMVQTKTAAAAPRLCQLRAMNSANALYVALRVPDPTVHDRLSPMHVDFALLAFCGGDELSAGDDRKLVVPGIYADKHVTEPGQDADDREQQGRGAMRHDQGAWCIEWAVPLDSGDAEDLQAKAGGVVRWNLAFFDGFQEDLTDTQVGVAWGADLEHAASWGTLHLAADVQDDGGRAFTGPAWVDALMSRLSGPVATRLRVTQSQLVSESPDAVAKVLVEYGYRDTAGEECTGRAKLYLPARLEQGEVRLPLFHAAGYELDDRTALAQVRRGFVVVSPRDLRANPLVQTINPDAALVHIARSLPFVDDARVVIGGGSAGGYMTLMLAAETFPLSGAAADVPPVNWGYNAAYFLQSRRGKLRMDDTTKQALPVFSAVASIAEQAVAVYGDNPDDPIWFRHSPLAQLDTITCPVLAYWSTADMLVPIDQVGQPWVRPFDRAAFPDGFVMEPELLCEQPEGRVRALEVLTDEVSELFVLTEDRIKRSLPSGASPPESTELPMSLSKQWSITILDEGPPEPAVGHVKYPVPWSRQNFIDHVIARRIAADQLTGPKLARLMDRYAGREWLPTRLQHLDFPDSERADVIRGLTLYVSAGPQHAATLTALYDQLAPQRQVLEPDVRQAIMASGQHD